MSWEIRPYSELSVWDKFVGYTSIGLGVLVLLVFILLLGGVL